MTQKNTTFFMSRGLVAAGVDGEVKTFSAPPSTLIQTIRTGARYGVPCSICNRFWFYGL